MSRTVTILADYASIGNGVAEIDAEDVPGTDKATPAPKPAPPAAVAPAGGADAAPPVPRRRRITPSRPNRSFLRDVRKLATVGVGRIPLESLADASVLFARGLVSRAAAGQPARTAVDGFQFGHRAAAVAIVRDDQPRDGGRLQELRHPRGGVLRQAGAGEMPRIVESTTVASSNRSPSRRR